MRQNSKQNRDAQSKLLRFRSQIRKNFIKSTIVYQRKNLLDSIDFQVLKSMLRNLDTLGFPKNQQGEKENLNVVQLIQLVDILQQHCQKANFNMQAQAENLGEGLSNVFLLYSKNISIQNKQKLIDAIDYLTFYSNESSKVLIQKQTFIDILRTEIVELGMKETTDIKYCKMIVILLMNLASQQRQQFNIYLAQSDICKSINEQIYKTLNIEKHKNQEDYTQEVSDLRKCALRLFKNVIMNFKKQSVQVAVNLVSSIIKDGTYFCQHPDRIFLLLNQALKIQHFWNEIMSLIPQLIMQDVSYAADTIQERCQKQYFLKNDKQTLTQRQQQLFYSFLKFLNQLNLQYDGFSQNTSYWGIFIQNLLNGFMLAEFIKIAHKNNKKDYLKTALTTYCYLSRSQIVNHQQLLIVKPIQDNYVLLKIFVDPSWTSNGDVADLCWEILKNLLQKEKSYYKQLMELLVIQRIEHTLENKFQRSAVLIQLLLFVKQLIVSFDEVDKILQILQNKNIVNKIQNLTNDPNRQIFEKAEMVVEIIQNNKKNTKSI